MVGSLLWERTLECEKIEPCLHVNGNDCCRKAVETCSVEFYIFLSLPPIACRYLVCVGLEIFTAHALITLTESISSIFTTITVNNFFQFNGFSSSLCDITCGVPQGSVLCFLLFLFSIEGPTLFFLTIVIFSVC